MAVMGVCSTLATLILAHQGGWDEALFVLAPLAIIGLLLLLANRRADAARRASDAADPDDT